MSRPEDFESLRREIASGDPGRKGGAIDRLIAALVPKVEALARRRFFSGLNPVESSRDLAMEVLFDLRRRLGDPRGTLDFESESRLMVYVDRMMRTRQASKVRRPRLPSAPAPGVEGEAAGSDRVGREPRPSFAARDAERRGQLGRLRAELFRHLGREEYRLVYRRFFQGQTYRQIADRLTAAGGDPPSAQAVGNRIARILDRLAPVLGEFEGCLDSGESSWRVQRRGRN